MVLILLLHSRFAWALVLYFATLGIWGITLGARNVGPTPSFRGAIVISVIAATVQGVLGLSVLVLGTGPSDPLHVLYGFTLVVAMPLASSLLQGRTPRGQAVGLGLAALFTAGLAIRGITTA